MTHSPAGAPFGLVDLIDLEVQIAADAEVDAEALAARDRPIAERLRASRGEETPSRGALLAGWLAALRDRQPELSDGERVARALRLTRLGLVIAGLLSGAGAAGWLLAYDGRTPVNIALGVAVLIGLQLAVLVALAFGLLLTRLSGGRLAGLPLVGDLRAVAQALVRLTDGLLMRADRAFREHEPEARARWRAGWRRLRARRSLYLPVERWWATGAMQAFGVAFNVGALAVILGRVAFSDLAFAWATTLEVSAAELTTTLSALATPWGWVWPAAVPDGALVEATRYSRLEAAYTGAGAQRAIDPALVGAWWRFLVAAVVTYGLLPRLGLALAARRGLRRSLAALPLDTPDVDRVVRRLTVRLVTTHAPEPEHVEAPPERVLSPAYDPAPAAVSWRVIAWRDFPIDQARLDAAIAAALDGVTGPIIEVSDYAAEPSALDAVAEDTAPAVVLAEAFEAPDKALRRFLRALRERAGPRRPLVVGLVGEARVDGWTAPTAEDITVWHQHLAIAEDPYLGLEVLGGAR